MQIGYTERPSVWTIQNGLRVRHSSRDQDNYRKNSTTWTTTNYTLHRLEITIQLLGQTRHNTRKTTDGRSHVPTTIIWKKGNSRDQVDRWKQQSRRRHDQIKALLGTQGPYRHKHSQSTSYRVGGKVGDKDRGYIKNPKTKCLQCLINDTKGGMRKGGHSSDTVWAWFHNCIGTVSDGFGLHNEQVGWREGPKTVTT